MSLKDLKPISLTLSSKAIARIIIVVAPIVLGIGYSATSFYIKMNETIEASAGLSSIKKDINELQIQLGSVKERQVESLNSNIRLQEKASEAYALSKESIALSKATSRETEAIAKAVQSEVDTKLEALNDKLEVIKRATTNPLDRR